MSLYFNKKLNCNENIYLTNLNKISAFENRKFEKLYI